MEEGHSSRISTSLIPAAEERLESLLPMASDCDSHDHTSEPIVDYNLLYDLIRLSRENSNALQHTKDHVQHQDLVPTLRPYQVQAVKWAMDQELHGSISGGILADEMGLGKTVEVLALILNNSGPPIPSLEWLEPESLPELWSPVSNEEDPLKKRKMSLVANKNYKQTSIREKLNLHYKKSLEKFSGLQSLHKKKTEISSTEIFCLCGDASADRRLVQCSGCGKHQHSVCVGYDLQDPYRGHYFCPQCWIGKDIVESRSTLIVTPASISHQWTEEIQRHIGRDDFKVLLYQGVSQQGFVQPQHLSNKYDVIITTYETLRRELYFADVEVNSGVRKRQLRRTSKYMAPPSPLLSVRFWRLCLDEAQLVEGSATRAAEMTRKLHAIHRWCVSGTPIQKSVMDLHGLLLFLGVEPFGQQHIFYEQLARPFLAGHNEPLVRVLAPIFWRTRKSQVEDQVRIPAQEQRVHWLRFSPIEEHFYRQQHQLCRADALKRFDTFGGSMSTKLSCVDRRTINALLQPLLRLRQACIHPQMVRGQFVALRHATMSMEELLVTLIKRAQTECEESQRQRVAAANGLAAIHIICEEWADAADKYRDILRWADEQKSIKIDTLQRIHALHNLAEVLHVCPQGSIAPTLRDERLCDEAELLKKQYLGRASTEVQGAQEILAPLTARVLTLSDQLEKNRIQLDNLWWVMLLEQSLGQDVAEKLVDELRQKLNEEARQSSGIRPSVAARFNDVHGLKLLLCSRLEEVDQHRQLIYNRFCWLQVQPTDHLAIVAAACHLRPLDDPSPSKRKKRVKRKRCPLCEVNDDLEDYETLLFRMDSRKNQLPLVESNDNATSDENEVEDTPNVLSKLRRGTWADSETEKMVKLLAAWARRQQAPTAIQEGASLQVRLLEAYRKEFRQLRALWRRLNDQASAIDELSMATLRLRLRLPHETSGPMELSGHSSAVYLLEPHEIDSQRSKLKADLVAAEHALKRHTGHVLYLKNLEGAEFGRSGGVNPDSCPICRSQLGSKWSVLVCGHSFCMECIQLLVGQCSGGRYLRCAICRETTTLTDIAYVDTQPISTGQEVAENVRVIGSHSTKIEAVVRQLLLIQAGDPGAKCLVFSSWMDVLVILSRALNENGLQHCILLSHSSHQNLSRFKNDPDMTCLLLPVHSGANGLNLIEATHVLLVEPILNPGSELQAIGRVHRIGQSRPTVVHRFLITATIEENLTQMLDRHRSTISGRSTGSSKENPITIADLQALFHKELPSSFPNTQH